MLKHYSHIRMEAKRSALEAIVDRRPVDAGPGLQDQDTKSSHELRNGRKHRARKDRTEAHNEKISAVDNAENLCSETLMDTQHFDREYPHPPQSGVFEIDGGVENRCKPLNLFGGRGGNRTYNLSV